MVSLSAWSSTGPTEQSQALRQIAADAPAYPDYQHLDAAVHEIRLLDLGDNFQYTIRHVSLHQNPKYFAVSYYWGAPGVTKSIWVNGHQIQLRKTVYQFLKSLYRQFGSITIWLDVICINQRDKQEQGSQVSMMGDIYTKAQVVYSWLGVGSADTDHALRYLHAHKSAFGSIDKVDQSMVIDGLSHMFAHLYWTR